MAKNPDGGAKVNRIYQQLQNEFHPAVKNLALAGQDVTKAQQGFVRSLQAYIGSVRSFAITGKGAEEPSKQVAKELFELTDVWQKTLDEHGKWAEHFAKVNVAVSRNAESEKDRLKNLQHEFGKKEKDLRKEVEKGRKSRANLDDFYDAELERATNQQKQRYKFFNEKHVELLKTHVVNCKFAIDAGQDVVDKYQASLNGLSRTNTVDTQSPKAERPDATAPIVESPKISKRSSVISAAQKSEKSQHPVEVHDDAHDDEKSLIAHLDSLPQSLEDSQQKEAEAVAPVPVEAPKKLDVVPEVQPAIAPVPEKKTTETQADLPPPKAPLENGHGPKPVAYTPAYYDARPPLEAFMPPAPARYEEQAPSPPPRAAYDQRPPAPTEDYYPAPQKVLPSSIYRPTPLVAQLKLDRERAGYGERPNPADVYDALYRQNSEGPQGDYQNGGGAPVHQQLQNKPSYVPLYAPIPERDVLHERPKAFPSERPLSQVGPPVAQKPWQQQRRESGQGSQPSSPPAAPKVFPRPIFSAADYGRMVECTTNYDATADNQLSLKLGDKVVLVKSGSRGWVLGRSEDGAKQGWFPAKFLRLI